MRCFTFHQGVCLIRKCPRGLLNFVLLEVNINIRCIDLKVSQSSFIIIRLRDQWTKRYQGSLPRLCESIQWRVFCSDELCGLSDFKQQLQPGDYFALPIIIFFDLSLNDDRVVINLGHLISPEGKMHVVYA